MGLSKKLTTDFNNRSECEENKMRIEMENPNPAASTLIRWADTKQLDSLGQTPLILAASLGNTAALKILIKHGVNVNEGSEDPEEPTALTTAVWQGSPANIKLLLDAGADLNIAANKDALNLAAAIGKADAITLLIQYGADVNGTNTKGSTPLAGALMYGNKDNIQLLLNAGADPRLGRNYIAGETPLEIAKHQEKTARTYQPKDLADKQAIVKMITTALKNIGHKNAGQKPPTP